MVTPEVKMTMTRCKLLWIEHLLGSHVLNTCPVENLCQATRTLPRRSKSLLNDNKKIFVHFYDDVAVPKAKRSTLQLVSTQSHPTIVPSRP